MTSTQSRSYDHVYSNFYQVERVGAVRLGDGGGPFGFDINIATMVDDLIAAYKCDGIVETGCFLGDTSVYLARTYSELPVWTCDVDPVFTEVAQHRLRRLPNARCETTDSPKLVNEANGHFARPIYYLDAHWEDIWPLLRELSSITHGIAIIDDFDIGHPRFKYDTYKGKKCGPDMLRDLSETIPYYYTFNPDAEGPFPVLQVGRRSGIGVVAFGEDAERACRTDFLVKHRNSDMRHPEGAAQ
ncbi:hypothetical protein [Streptomyces sp. NPDC050485]|uniref:hypothetical protein n=1 Tax=Streptomyces sp. NPDC050485 TaxID=3365617 RepID=UPI003797E45B